MLYREEPSRAFHPRDLGMTSETTTLNDRLSPAGPPAALPLVRGARRTLAGELRLQLADEIVRGVLAPGAALDETELARRFQVSRTPVREAIRLLTASGLVEARAHRAAAVARPDASHLAGM